MRIGLWLGESRASRYTRAFVAWAKSRTDLVVVGMRPAAVHEASEPVGAVATALRRATRAIETALLRRNARYREHLECSDVKALDCRIVWLAGDSSDAAAVRALELDLFVCLGTALVPEPLAASTRLGTVAFEWAEQVEGRGRPVGFWEVFARQDTTGFAIQGIAPSTHSRSTLLQGWLPTRHYHLLNQAALYEKAHHYLRRLLAGVAESGQLPSPVTSKATGRAPAGWPSTGASLAYLRRLLSAMARKRLARLASRDERWQVSFLRVGWRLADLRQGRAIDNPAGRYLADPFVIQRDGHDYCFVEDFDCASGRGCISAYALDEAEARPLGAVLSERFHLSFPFLFEYAGALFMCPETSQNRDIRVYRCVDFPLQWRLEKILMSDLSAADTMLFEREGKWWMLTNIDPAETGEICSELYVFSSDSPLSQAWRPHAGNPVLLDAACARNGGLLVDGDDVFRVSQRQGFDRYGKGSQINQLVSLSDETYEERCIVRIDPTFKRGILGTHHLHSKDGITVFDTLSETSARETATA